MSCWDGFVDSYAEPPTSPYVGRRAVADTDLPSAPVGVRLRVVLTGGAAQVAGPLAACERRGLDLAALDTTLRDPGDLVGNTRRVVAALGAEPVPEQVEVHVRVPGPPTPSALAALDELALVDAVLALPSDAEEQWLDAALDREVALSLVGGSPTEAVAAVLAVARLWGDPGDAAVGRRFVRSWLTDDPATALTHLEALS